MANVNEPRTPVDAALDLFVYAPLGLALEARELVPKLAERGRGQVALVRLFGRFALQRGQAEADRVLGRRDRPAPTPAPVDADVVVAEADVAAADDAAREAATAAAGMVVVDEIVPVTEDGRIVRADKPKAKATPSARPWSTLDAPPPAAEAAAAAAAEAAAEAGSEDEAEPMPVGEVPAVEDLAIPGYDSLSASQVVPRLDALRASELDAVGRYEAAHRGRRTILNRVAQLQD
jgi:pyruvate/2-oxoglutarate dehydrogenase complex dihydrolipoamide acyltransferase (E2) component